MSTQPIVTLCVAAAILILALAEGGHEGAPLGIAVVAVWALLGALLATGRVRFGAATAPLAAVAAALAALAAFAALSTAWASDDGGAFVEVNRFLLALGVVGLVGLAARSGGAPAWLAGIAIGGTAVALVALGSRFFGFGADRELAEALPLSAQRLSYPIGYWNGLGYLMAMTATALFWLAGTGRDRAAAAAVAATVPVVVTIFLTSSRGAILMTLLGAACVTWLIASRSHLIAAAIVAVPAWILAVVATAARRSYIEPPAEPGAWAIALAIGIVIVALLAARAYPIVAQHRFRPRRLRVAAPVIVAGGLAALLAAVAVFGVDSFVGDFRGVSPAGNEGAAAGLASGSDRGAFWGTALEALGDEPLLGVGAGGYANYWNQFGSLGNSVDNAHSAPIEELAELGLIGGGLFLALLVIPLWAVRRRLREARAAGALEDRSLCGPVLGILLIGLFAVGIDWTWDLPAALAPALICAGLACGRALTPASAPEGSLLTDSRMPGYEWADTPARPAPLALGLGTAAVGAAAIWCGVVLTAFSIQYGISSDRLEEGDLDGAAEAARAAASIQPWSVEPSLRLAEIEQAGTNYEAARRRAEEATRESPDDFRPWLLLYAVHLDLGNSDAAEAYRRRAFALAPLVLGRSVLEGTT